MKTSVLVGMVILMAAIGPSMVAAAPAAQMYTLVQVPVIELNRIDGPGGAYAWDYLAARIRAAVAKSGKDVVAISGNQFADVSATQDRVTASGRYATPNRKWANPGQMISPTNHFSVTGETGYYEEDGGRQIAGAVVSAVLTSALTPRHGGRGRQPVSYGRYGGGAVDPIDWRKKNVYVDLTLEAPRVDTGLYGKLGTVHGRGTASLEDVGTTSTYFRGRQPATCSSQSRNTQDGGEVKLFQKAAERALADFIAGLPNPEVIGSITVRSGKALVEGKSTVDFFRGGDETPIASYQVLAVEGDRISVWPLVETSRPDQKLGDKFVVVQ